MRIKLKRIYSFWIELLALLVITYFIFEFTIGGLILVLRNYHKANMIAFMYIKPILGILILLYFILRNIIGGHSILQAIFKIKYEFSTKKQLILKNIIDLVTLPISLLLVLIKNKTIGDYICKVNVCETEPKDTKNTNYILFFMIIWFTIIPILLFFTFSWRINKSEESLAFKLNNSQTIKDHIGTIKYFSFADKIFWSQYDKNGEYTEAKVKNDKGQKFKIKIYHNSDDSNVIDYLIINGEKYTYEIELFDFNKYKDNNLDQFKEFNDEIIVSEIKNQKDVITSSKEAYKSKYSKELSGYHNYELFYDKENDVYMIHYISSTYSNTLNKYCTIIMNSTGKVLLISLEN